MNRFFLGAYWSPRRESLDQCTDRLLGFLHDLKTCDDTLVHWYQLGSSRAQALKNRVDTSDRVYFLELLRRRHRKRGFENLGYSVDLWNGGDDDKAVGLSVTCGLYFERLGNHANLNLPDDLGELAKATN